MSWNIDELADNNANNWVWRPKSLDNWELATQDFQDFCKRWHGAAEAELEDVVSIEFEDISSVTFLVRAAYKSMFKLVWMRGLYLPSTGVVLTGQPGIGKTTFLWYMLVRLLMKRQLVVFGTYGCIYLFFEGQVYIAKNNAALIFPTSKNRPKSFIWSLIDHDESEAEPQPGLLTTKVFPVQAASPNPSRYKTWFKHRGAAMWGLPLWDEEELNLGISLQPEYERFAQGLSDHIGPLRVPSSGGTAHQEAYHILQGWQLEKDRLLEALGPDDATLEEGIFTLDITSVGGAFRVLVHNAIQEYGFVARHVYKAIFGPTLLRVRRQMALETANYNTLLKMAESFRLHLCFPAHGTSHMLICVFPTAEPGGYNDPIEWSMDFASPSISREVIQKMEEKHSSRVDDLFLLFRAFPQTSILAGRLLEPISNRILLKDKRKNLLIYEMEGQQSDAPVFNVNFSTSPPVKPSLPGGVRKPIQFHSNAVSDLGLEYYYIPHATTHPLFDSFLVERVPSSDKNQVTLVLWVFQITTAGTHRGSCEGYVSVRKIVSSLKTTFGQEKKRDSNRQPIKPAVKVEVKYVLVCPVEEESKRQWRMPNGWDKSTLRNDHRGRVYCVRIPLPSGSKEVLALLE